MALMTFEEVGLLDFNIASLERVFVKKGQQELYGLILGAANGKKRLEITFPKKIGDGMVRAKSQDPRLNFFNPLATNKPTKLISINTVQTRKGVGFTILAHEEGLNGRVYSYAVWFESEEPGIYLKVEDLELNCVDPRKNN